MTFRTNLCATLAIFCPLEVLAYTITVFPQAAYNANVATMNGNLGLTSPDLHFEDFDDAILIPELHVSGVSHTTGNNVGFGNSQLRAEMTSSGWKLDHALKVGGYISPVKFEIVDGVATTFGFGITNDQGTSARIRINGGTPYRLSDFSNYHTSIGNPAPYRRNGYVKIESDVGDDPIRFVQIYNGGGDLIWVDHIAIAYIAPEPASLMLSALGAVILAARRRTRK